MRKALGPSLALLCLLPVACEDSGTTDDPLTGGGSCRSMCSAFLAGTNCEETPEEDCRAGCEELVALCPGQEAPLLACLGDLDYECLGPGVAVARGGSQAATPVFLTGSPGSLEVQDADCAAIAETFLACEDPTLPPASCVEELGCQPPLVADCSSAACVAAVAGESDDALCSNGTDDDGNGYVDCDDFFCSLNPVVTVCGVQELDDASCSNGLDDDGNGYIDCADLHCQISLQVTLCPAERGQAACSNGDDDDGDGRIDCADASCKGSPFVSCP